MTIPLIDPDLVGGTTLGKYEVLKKLAVGGMAEIYLARVRGIVGFEKLVVLKRILPNMADDPSFVQMFLDEARLAATLQHPNIAHVFDVGSENKTYFFTMEYIHGEDARAVRIQSRKLGQPIPIANALAIVHGTASALDYAHNKVGPDGPLQLVHRDVSTSNILISFDGAVKLVDFGIARATSRHSKTRTGTLKGKIPYMSPEQCQNRPLDRRSDLFSLGVVLYELTVGRRPFRGDSDFEILDQIINKGAQPPSQLVADYPRDLEKVVLKLLARPAAERYQTGEQLLEDLEAVMTARGGWVSPNALGRYLKSLFPDKAAAWNTAQESGASLGDHLAHTITSDSVKAERRTPVSSFSAVAPPDDAPTTATPGAIPAPRPRRRWMIAGAMAVVGIAIAVIVVRSLNDASQPPQLADPVVTPKPEPPRPEPVAKPEPRPEPKPEPRPAPIEMPATKPEPIVVGKKPPPPASKPKPSAKKPDPKEQPWDPNSMFLPK